MIQPATQEFDPNAATAPARDLARIAIEFFVEPVYDEKTATWSDVDYVRWVKKGTQAFGNRCRVRSVKSDYPELWPIVEPAYKAWKAGQEPPVDGTPLTAWAGVSPAQVRMLQALNLRSVEDVAGMTDADMERVGMGARDLKAKAAAYVDALRDKALVVEQNLRMEQALAARDEQIKEQADALAAMQEQLRQLQGDLRAAQAAKAAQQPHRR